MGKNEATYTRLDDKAEQAVTELMEEKGLTKSSAVNTIIREWSEMKKQYVTVPVAGVIKDGVVAPKEEPFDWNSKEGGDEIAAAER